MCVSFKINGILGKMFQSHPHACSTSFWREYGFNFAYCARRIGSFHEAKYPNRVREWHTVRKKPAKTKDGEWNWENFAGLTAEEILLQVRTVFYLGARTRSNDSPIPSTPVWHPGGE